MTRLFYDLAQIEATISHRALPNVGDTGLVHIAGTSPILLSASHATAHVRNGKLKFEEEFTAAFAAYLAQRLGCHALYPTHMLADDPNYDAHANYKTTLAKIVTENNIEIVLDLHGMIRRHKLGVAIGTINGKAFPDSDVDLITPFVHAGFHEVSATQRFDAFDWHRVVLNHPRFTGGIKQQTVTRFVSEALGCLAMQIELVSAIRIVYLGPNEEWKYHFFGDLVGISMALAGLEGLIKALQQHIRG